MVVVMVCVFVMLEEGFDIFIFNCFGKGESEGKGLCVVFEVVSFVGVLVLILVKEIYFELWCGFVGGMLSDFVLDLDVVLCWCCEVIVVEVIKVV